MEARRHKLTHVLVFTYRTNHAHTHTRMQADQLVRALHALYASGATAPQLYDNLASALLEAPRDAGPATASAPNAHAAATRQTQPDAPEHGATAPRHTSGAAQVVTGGSKGRGSNSSSTAAATPAAAGLRPSPTLAGASAAAAPSSGMPPINDTTASAATGRGVGLSLWQLQSVYSVFKALEHPQAEAFSQVRSNVHCGACMRSNAAVLGCALRRPGS